MISHSIANLSRCFKTCDPGVGPLTALAFVLVIGTAERFRCGKQIASYLGLVPSEDSSGERRRLGHISKQGKFFHLAMRRGRKIAKVAMAHRLAIRLYCCAIPGCCAP